MMFSRWKGSGLTVKEQDQIDQEYLNMVEQSNRERAKARQDAERERRHRPKNWSILYARDFCDEHGGDDPVVYRTNGGPRPILKH